MPFENISDADTRLYYRGWISAAGWAGVEIEDFPRLKAWEDRMWARPAVQKGANVPDKYTMKEKMKDKESMEKYAAEVSERSCTEMRGRWECFADGRDRAARGCRRG